MLRQTVMGPLLSFFIFLVCHLPSCLTACLSGVARSHIINLIHTVFKESNATRDSDESLITTLLVIHPCAFLLLFLLCPFFFSCVVTKEFSTTTLINGFSRYSLKSVVWGKQKRFLWRVCEKFSLLRWLGTLPSLRKQPFRLVLKALISVKCVRQPLAAGDVSQAPALLPTTCYARLQPETRIFTATNIRDGEAEGGRLREASKPFIQEC